jgi:hypothetical protein
MNLFLVILAIMLMVLSLRTTSLVFWAGVMLIVIAFLRRGLKGVKPTSAFVDLADGRRMRMCADSHCRHANELRARFCARCGQLLK